MLGLLSGDLPAQGELFFVVDLEVNGQRVELLGGSEAAPSPHMEWDPERATIYPTNQGRRGMRRDPRIRCGEGRGCHGAKLLGRRTRDLNVAG